MSFYYLINSTTGEKLGETADNTVNIPDMRGREWITFDSRPVGTWNPRTRSMDALPVKVPSLTIDDFVKRFRKADMDQIHTKMELEGYLPSGRATAIIDG